MAISDEITRLQNAKAALKTSIEDKGVTVPSATTIDGYAALVDSISGGGGGNGYETKVSTYGMVFGALTGGYTYEMPLAISDYIAIPSNCTSIKVRIGGKNMNGIRIHLYDSEKTYKTYQLINNSSYTKPITVTAGTYSYIRVCVDLDYVDVCYVLDQTNNTYLWKGNNVT